MPSYSVRVMLSWTMSRPASENAGKEAGRERDRDRARQHTNRLHFSSASLRPDSNTALGEKYGRQTPPQGWC